MLQTGRSVLATVLLFPFQDQPALGRDWDCGGPTRKNKVLLEPGLRYSHPREAAGAFLAQAGAYGSAAPWCTPTLCRLTCWFPLLQSFESWMHKWLLFEMAKNPKLEQGHKAIPAEQGIRGGGCRAWGGWGWGVRTGPSGAATHQEVPAWGFPKQPQRQPNPLSPDWSWTFLIHGWWPSHLG